MVDQDIISQETDASESLTRVCKMSITEIWVEIKKTFTINNLKLRKQNKVVLEVLFKTAINDLFL